MAKWSSKKYIQAAKTLKKLGYSITYKGNDRKTFKQRGIIKKLYNNKKSYINFAELNPKGKTRTLSKVGYQFKFQKLTPKQIAKLKRTENFSLKQFTKGGVFIEKPVNVPSNKFRIRFSDTGEIRMRYGSLDEVLVKLDPKKLVVNPKKEIQDKVASRKPDNVSLVVNGFKAAAAQSFTLNQFSMYMENELVPDWLKHNRKYYDNKAEAMKAFTDIFHARLLYFKRRWKSSAHSI